MKKILLFLLICVIFLSAEVIQPALLEKMQKNPNEKFHIWVTLKEQFSIEQIREELNLYDNEPETIQTLIDTLKQKTEESQNICRFLQNRKNVENLKFFWLTNAISLDADAETIHNLAQYPEIERIILIEKKKTLTPIDSNKNESSHSSREDNSHSSREYKSNWGLKYIHADKAHLFGYKGEGVTVAVIDTGIDKTHPNFAPGQILPGWTAPSCKKEEDLEGHGTHVAGIIGSQTYGVAPKSKILPIKVGDDYKKDFGNDAIIEGIQYAIVNKADIINMSFGSNESYLIDPVRQKLELELLTSIKKAIALNKIVVIAAGNEGVDQGSGVIKDGTINTPGVLPEAITVGGINNKGILFHIIDKDNNHFGSGIGPIQKEIVDMLKNIINLNSCKPEVVAPGDDIWSTYKDNGFKKDTGSSQATPHVSGVIALMLSKRKLSKKSPLTPQQVKSILQGTAFGTKKANYYGAGCVDALAALNAPVPSPVPIPPIHKDQSGSHCGMIGLEFIFALSVCFLIKRKLF